MIYSVLVDSLFTVPVCKSFEFVDMSSSVEIYFFSSAQRWSVYCFNNAEKYLICNFDIVINHLKPTLIHKIYKMYTITQMTRIITYMNNKYIQ